MARLSLSFLGAFQATLGRQLITNFRSANVQGLLAYLAMQMDRPFSRDVLATLFWPEEDEITTRANLRQSLYQLRKVLRDDEQERPFLLINRHTVQFNQESNTILDIIHFLAALESNDLGTAISYYQGDLLPGFTCNSLEFEEWLRLERELLHWRALEALYQWTKQLLGDGRYQQAQTAARRQLELEPWREEGHQQLMLALALNGERSAALAQYESCRRLLAEELGAEPSAEIVTLYERIAAGEELGVRRATAILTPPHNLLAPTTTYFGRAQEQAELLEQLTQPDHRFTTLVGEGGIGKSRLALEVAWQLREQFPDGVWFVPLAELTPLADMTELQDSIATAVIQAMHHSLSGQQSPQSQLRSFLRDRHTLLVLDNFEHLLNGAELVLDLLQHAPGLTVLCTSREPLGFMAEWGYQLDQLPLPPPPPTDPSQWLKVVEVDIPSYASVQLFMDRATRAGGHFALTSENENQVAHLCRLVAGIPLGLELAAASLRQRPLPQLINTIENSLGSLVTHLRDVPPRHRTLRAVFESSWALLTAAEQNLFASLSVFRGGFTAAAVQGITQANPNQLQSLADKSLLQMQDSQRFHLHEHLRQFAAEKLASLFHQTGIATRHSTYYLNFAAEQEAALVGKEPQTAVQTLTQELDNIRQAWQTAVVHQQTPSFASCLLPLADFYQIRGLYREAAQRFGQAATQLTDKATIAHLLTHQAGALIRLSRYPAAVELIEQALSFTAYGNDQWVQSKLHIYWGEALWRQGELEEAETKLNRAWEIAEALNSRPLAGSALFHLGIVYDYRGNVETALGYLDTALLIWRLLGNRRQQGFTLNSIGAVAQQLPHLSQRAQIALTEALTISQANKDFQGQSMALNNLSLLATAKKDYEAAKSYLTKALQLAEFVGDTHGQALLSYNLGWNALEAGWLNEARSYADLALKLSRHIGDQRGEGRTLQLLGDLEKENGRFPQSLTYYQSALAIYQKTGHQDMQEEVEQAIEAVTHQIKEQRQEQPSPLLK
jgi:predicted ATPase/DNA-binding SARP family transcriptional activator